MANNPYWQDRQEKKYLAGEKKVNDYYRDLKKSFEQSKREIQSKINDFYWRYAEENQISFASAQLKLSQAEIGELQDFIDLVNENMGKYNQELNNMSIRARITRYEALEKQIDAILQELYAVEYQYKGEEFLKEIYFDTYYRTWFNIDQYHGFHQEFAQIGAKTVEELIRYPFNGADFSTRIWKQKDHMLQRLNESITTMLIQGRNPKTLSKEMSKMFGTKEYEAYRLLHTEGSFIMGQGTLAGYQEDGVTKYRILATLDMKTSDKCRGMDGKEFNVEDAIVGINYWPFHPHCRTTDVPVYEGDDLSDETRVARDPVTGMTYDVPADMTYQEWHKKYIEDNPKALIEEKKWKNRHADQKQCERYQGVLGKDLGVKSLDDFQNLKYNEIENFKLMKIDFSRRNRLIRNPSLKLPDVEKAVIAEDKFTKYLFAGKNEDGLIKGRLISSKLGYDISNYKEFEKDILTRARFNPSRAKGQNKQGVKYEQRIIFYSKNNTPVNLEVGWLNSSSGTHMTSIYVNEVKKNEN